MRAITVWQPWATLLVLGFKQFETRPRATHVRGRIAIHAAKRPPCSPFERLRVGPYRVEFDNGRYWMMTTPADAASPIRVPLACGAVVGTVELVGCIQTEGLRVPALERQLGDFTPGRFAWLMRNPDPIAWRNQRTVRGKQGWWDWTSEGGD